MKLTNWKHFAWAVTLAAAALYKIGAPLTAIAAGVILATVFMMRRTRAV